MKDWIKEIPKYCPQCGRSGMITVIGTNDTARLIYFECRSCRHLWRKDL